MGRDLKILKNEYGIVKEFFLLLHPEGTALSFMKTFRRRLHAKAAEEVGAVGNL